MNAKRIRALLLASATAALVATAVAPGTASANVCADANGGFNSRWGVPSHVMLINELTYIQQMDVVKVRARLMDAADTWNREINTCGFSPSFVHTTIVTPGPFASENDRPDGNRFNGNNQVAFGPIRGAQWGDCDVPGILACNAKLVVGGDIRESDVQFHMPLYWWGGRENTTPGNAHDVYVPEGWYDLWGLAAHEYGHAVGQTHATNAGTNLTMRPQFCAGMVDSTCAPVGGPSANARTLGLGDVHHYRTNYRR